MSNDDLLRPTLADFRRPPALFSSTGFFLSSFFGGPAGTTLYGLANSYRLGRLVRDLPLFLAFGATAFLALDLLHAAGYMQALGELLGTRPLRTYEIVLRALALANFGAIYFMHRKFFRAARVASAEPLMSWPVGLAAAGLGWLANWAFIGWLLKHH